MIPLSFNWMTEWMPGMSVLTRFLSLFLSLLFYIFLSTASLYLVLTHLQCYLFTVLLIWLTWPPNIIRRGVSHYNHTFHHTTHSLCLIYLLFFFVYSLFTFTFYTFYTLPLFHCIVIFFIPHYNPSLSIIIIPHHYYLLVDHGLNQSQYYFSGTSEAEHIWS